MVVTLVVVWGERQRLAAQAVEKRLRRLKVIKVRKVMRRQRAAIMAAQVGEKELRRAVAIKVVLAVMRERQRAAIKGVLAGAVREPLRRGAQERPRVLPQGRVPELNQE